MGSSFLYITFKIIIWVLPEFSEWVIEDTLMLSPKTINFWWISERVSVLLFFYRRNYTPKDIINESKILHDAISTVCIAINWHKIQILFSPSTDLFDANQPRVHLKVSSMTDAQKNKDMCYCFKELIVKQISVQNKSNLIPFVLMLLFITLKAVWHEAWHQQKK